MWKLAWLVVLVMALGSMGQAMMAAISDEELVATSDLIILGTATQTSVRLENPQGWANGQAEIRVDKVLKGEKLQAVTVRHALPPLPQPGMMIMDHGGFVLQQGQQNLIFLTRAPWGYTITAGMMGVRPLTDEAKATALIAAQPVTVSFNGNIGPFVYNKETTVSIMVKNTGKTPMQLFSPSAQVFFPAIAGSVSLDIQSRQTEKTPAPIIVQPGAEQAVTLLLTMPQPATVKAQTTEQLPATMRVRVFVQAVDAAGQRQGTGYYVASSWVNVLTGFPLVAAAK